MKPNLRGLDSPSNPSRGHPADREPDLQLLRPRALKAWIDQVTCPWLPLPVGSLAVRSAPKRRFCIWDRCGVLVVFVAVVMVVADG
jgi:hypothetical protein